MNELYVKKCYDVLDIYMQKQSFKDGVKRLYILPNSSLNNTGVKEEEIFTFKIDGNFSINYEPDSSADYRVYYYGSQTITIPIFDGVYQIENPSNNPYLYITKWVKKEKKYNIISFNEVIKLNKSLKELFNFENNTFSKTFKIPRTKETEIFSEKNTTSFKGLNFYEYILYTDDIEISTGEIFINKFIDDNKKDKYIELFLIGTKKTLFEELENTLLINIDDEIELQTALNISNNINTTTSGEEAKANNIKHTYSLMEMGENITELLTKPALTQDTHSPILGKVGLMADSFIPSFWNHYVFTKLHEYLGYDVDGDILDDPDFLNIVIPAIKKTNNNYYDDEFDIEKLIFSGWYPDNSVWTGDINSYSWTSEESIIDPISSTNQVLVGKFLNDGINSGYSRYDNNYTLGSVRQIIDFSNLRLETYYTDDVDGANDPQPIFNIRFYGAQQYDEVSNTAFESVLLEEFNHVIFNTSSIYLNIDFNVNGDCDKNLFYSYKDSVSALTYFYITYEYVDTNGTTVVSDTFNIRFRLIGLNEGIGTKQNPANDEYYIKFNRSLNQNVGVNLLDKNKTGLSYINDMIAMFNLTVEINNKKVTYNKFNTLTTNIDKNLSPYLIENTLKIQNKSKKTGNTIKIYFQKDDNDLLTKEYINQSDSNPSERYYIYGKKTNKENIIEVSTNFYFNGNISIGNYDTYILENKEFVDKINYNNFKTIYAYINFEDTQGNDEIKLSDINLDVTYLMDVFPLLSFRRNNNGLSFQNTVDLTNNSDISSNLYTDFYHDINYNTSNKNFYEAYFYLSVDVFMNLDLSKLVYIDNELYYINKIIDWDPNSKTKIEFIKIT